MCYVQDTETALDTYVHADDGEWRWSLEAEYNMNGVDVYVLNMTSQKWMDGERKQIRSDQKK